MRNRVVLLLSLATLVANFVVALGATETQTRVLRTTARVACSAPLPAAADAVPRPVAIPAAPAEGEAPPGPGPRLVKFLARLDDLHRLDARQVEALFRATHACRRELARTGAALGGAGRNGAWTRARIDDVDARVRRRVAAELRAASVPEGELLARLVRVVIAASG